MKKAVILIFMFTCLIFVSCIPNFDSMEADGEYYDLHFLINGEKLSFETEPDVGLQADTNGLWNATTYADSDNKSEKINIVLITVPANPLSETTYSQDDNTDIQFIYYDDTGDIYSIDRTKDGGFFIFIRQWDLTDPDDEPLAKMNFEGTLFNESGESVTITEGYFEVIILYEKRSNPNTLKSFNLRLPR